MDFHTEPLSSLPPGCTPDAVTSDGRAVCFWLQEDDRTRFVWDGQVGEPFDDLVGMRDGGPAIFASDDDADRAVDLDRTVLAAYEGGLRAEGWSGDHGTVSLGLNASLALRYWFVRDTLRGLSVGGLPAGDSRVLIAR